MTIICEFRSLNALRIAVVAVILSATTPASLAQSAMIDGQVAKIDEQAEKITIKHGPLKQFGMEEPMTMVYRASDPAMLKTVKIGDKVKFVANRVNGQFVITKIEKAR